MTTLTKKDLLEAIEDMPMDFYSVVVLDAEREVDEYLKKMEE